MGNPTESNFRKKAGQQIRMIRTYRRMSQGEMARLVGRNKGYISDVENGKANVTIDVFGDICKVLDCDMNFSVNPEL